MSWKALVLGEALEVLIDYRGKTPKKLGADFVPDGVPVASALLVSNGRLDLTQARFVAEETWRAWMKVPTKAGDVLLTSEAPMGRVALVPDDGPLVLGQRLFALRGRPGVLDNRFLYYALQTTQVQSDLAGRTTGTTVVGIRQSALRDVTIPAPEVSQQQAIADVLGALDDKIAANDRLASSARSLARELFNQGVDGVSSVRMSTVLAPLLGGTPKRSDETLWDGSIPWASAKDITGAPHGVIIETAEGISESAAAPNRLRPLPSGSVVLTARGTVGVAAQLAVPASINQSCYGFVPGTIPAGCLVFAVEDAARQAKNMAHGSVFDTITMRTFESVAIPDLDAQEWAEIEEQVSPLMTMVQTSVLESRVLASTRDELLPLLMSGRITVREAEKTVEELV